MHSGSDSPPQGLEEVSSTVPTTVALEPMRKRTPSRAKNHGSQGSEKGRHSRPVGASSPFSPAQVEENMSHRESICFRGEAQRHRQMPWVPLDGGPPPFLYGIAGTNPGECARRKFACPAHDGRPHILLGPQSCAEHLCGPSAPFQGAPQSLAGPLEEEPRLDASRLRAVLGSYRH